MRSNSRLSIRFSETLENACVFRRLVIIETPFSLVFALVTYKEEFLNRNRPRRLRAKYTPCTNLTVYARCISSMSTGIWRRPSAGTTHGGSRPDLAAMIMTEDAKTEEEHRRGPCGAYIETPCKFDACRAEYIEQIILQSTGHPSHQFRHQAQR